MKETYIKPEIRSEVLEPEALTCNGSGNDTNDCWKYPRHYRCTGGWCP